MSIIPFPVSRPMSGGIVHVMGDAVAGFEVAHESRSGNSWGGFYGPFARGEEAITFAYALNRDTYSSECEVFICDAAVEDANPGVGRVYLPGEF